MDEFGYTEVTNPLTRRPESANASRDAANEFQLQP